MCALQVVLIIISATFNSAQASDKAPVVQFKSGLRVVGTRCASTSSVAFRGIRYGVAERWQSPRVYSYPRNKTTVDATAYGPWCPQPFLASSPLAYGAFNVSEDCLFLNIWAPDKATRSSRLPVRVFVHGGSYASGGGAWDQYEGCMPAADAAVILVTLNYCVAALGFLGLPGLRSDDDNSTGNFGLQDMRVALQWLHQHVASFGGDPKRVMLHGQSAGGDAVFAHMMLPRSWGLFSATVSESGSPDYGAVSSLQDVYLVSGLLRDQLGCNATAARAKGFVSPAQCMRSAPVGAVVNATQALPGWVAWGPTVDGVEFKKPPLDILKEGKVSKAPFVAGYTSNEGAVFVLGWMQSQGIQGSSITEAQFKLYLESSIPVPPKFLPQVYAQYDATKYYGGSWIGAAMYMTTHSEYLCPTYRGVRYFSAAGTPSWLYTFNQPPPGLCWVENYLGLPAQEASFVAPLFNSSHTTELPLVFMLPFAGRAVNKGCNYSADEAHLASFTSGIFTSMAKARKPLPAVSRSLAAAGPVRLRNQSAAAWPRFTAARPQGYQLDVSQPGRFDTTFLAEVCALWDEINASITAGGTAYFPN